MSMKLVRKFLQEDDPAVDAAAVASQKKKRKRRRDSDKEAATVATKEEILQATVQSEHGLLDQAMTTFTGKTDSKNAAMQRMNEKAKIAKKRRKKLQRDTIVGNSRSSSSQLRLPSAPTFDKKRYKKEQEEKRLKEIAKLLKKQSKKNKK
eukprot:CAMPEP_0116146286 /NCGR_PEP_ID=MMETSP0329-20121206/17084_1 /TAXON_ID=697910 /ORGANISM="Pseudo-nitzschia arenysensis, Strain B593" /LENGTH=149 /DNA_ID=CAMNT_0003642025 /DNA_START=21 /DNA_END=471 /DNA_ORIENTATION=-